MINFHTQTGSSLEIKDLEALHIPGEPFHSHKNYKGYSDSYNARHRRPGLVLTVCRHHTTFAALPAVALLVLRFPDVAQGPATSSVVGAT